MQKTIILELENVKLICPEDFQPIRETTIENYPDFCGPSSLYLLNKIIPDRLAKGKVNIAISCHIHDEQFAYKVKSWEHFHSANNIMFRNSFAIFEKFKDKLTIKEQNKFIIDITKYLIAVDSIGAVFYWKH